MKVYVVLKSNSKTEVVEVFNNESGAEAFVRFMEFYDSDHSIEGNEYFYQEFEVKEWKD